MNHIRGRYEKAQEQLTSLIQDEPRDLLLNKFESIGSNVKTYLDASRSVTNAATLTLATKNRSADEIFARVRQDQTQSLDRLSDDIGKVYADMRIPLVNVQDGILNSLVPFENLAREKANNTQIIHDDAISYIQQERNEINLLVTQNVKADIPTGTTPRKNDYNYSETWSSTEESSFPSPLRPSTPLSSTLTEINIPDNIDITSTNSKKRTYSRMPMPLKRLKISSDVFEVDEQ
ncbi:hypothetical protein G9A89_012314 [Geosiphon pyriformis]|nr:hypothetical protein G9A89_012314 [Geosiphon pyriformis]